MSAVAASPQESTGRIVVELSYAEGRPAAGVVVRLRDESAAISAEATTDAAGRCTLARTAGTVHYALLQEGVPTAVGWLTVTAGADTVLREQIAPIAYLEGHLVGAEGEDLAGARVLLRERELGDVATAETDAQGRFRVAVPDELLQAVVQREGYRELRALADPKVFFEWQMTPLLAVTGRVVTAEGEGVAGATVRARTVRKGLPRIRDDDLVQTTTASDGSFTFPGVPAGPVRIEAEVEGSFPATAELEARPGARVELRVTKGASLAGVVLDAAGRPVAGATVHAEATGPAALEAEILEADTDAEGNPRSRLQKSTSTDAQGRFCLAPLQSGTYALAVHAKGHPSWRRQGIELAQDQENVTVTLDGARAPALVTVAGTVLDAQRKPLDGCTVFFARLHGGSPDPCRTNAKGRFSARVPPGSYLITASEQNPDEPESHEIEALVHAPANARRIEVELVDGAPPDAVPLRGRVMGTDGPLAGLRLTFVNDVPGAAMQWTTTDAEGRFAFEQAMPGEGLVVFPPDPTAPRRAGPSGARRVHLDERGAELDIAPWRTSVRGRFTAVPARSTAALLGDAQATGSPLRYGLSAGGHAALSEDGAFEILEVPPGRYVLALFASDSGDPPSGEALWFPGVRVTEGEAIDLGALALPAQWAELTIAVEDEAKGGLEAVSAWIRPVRDQRVDWLPLGDMSESGHTRVRLAPGSYDVAVTASGRAPVLLGPLALAAGSKTVSAKLQRGGVVSAVVEAPDGTPVRGAVIELVAPDESTVLLPPRPLRMCESAGHVREDITDAGGRWVGMSLPLGKYRVRARADGREAISDEIVITRTGGAQLDLQLR